MGNPLWRRSPSWSSLISATSSRTELSAKERALALRWTTPSPTAARSFSRTFSTRSAAEWRSTGRGRRHRGVREELHRPRQDHVGAPLDLAEVRHRIPEGRGARFPPPRLIYFKSPFLTYLIGCSTTNLIFFFKK